MMHWTQPARASFLISERVLERKDSETERERLTFHDEKGIYGECNAFFEHDLPSHPALGKRLVDSGDVVDLGVLYDQREVSDRCRKSG